MNQYYVYIYFDNETPFYVGMGQGKRHLDHIKDAEKAIRSNAPRNKLSHKLNKIIKILSENRRPKVEIVSSSLSYDNAANLEKELIAKLGRKDLGLGTLTNLTNGGDGVQGRTTMVSPTGEAISILKEDKPVYESIGYTHFNKGRKHSDEVNSKKQAPWTGKSRPDHGGKIKIAAANGSYKNRPLRGPHSETTLEKMRQPKGKREGYKNRKWYHSKILQLEVCINTAPDWPDLELGRLPRP